MNKKKCNCCIGFQYYLWETSKVEENDFFDGTIDIYTNIVYHNYCFKCGKKIDKKKYEKLFDKLKQLDEKGE